MTHKLIFKGKTIYSSKFKDIYYDPQYGLEESNYVFIKGCQLEKELTTTKNIKIAELEFGTGLNLIALLKYLTENNIKTKINYYSIEKFPLKKEQIKKYHNFLITIYNISR